MSEEIFQDNPYQNSVDAVVKDVNLKQCWFTVDKTVFYPTGGGQPGDTGIGFLKNDVDFRIVDTRRDRVTGEICHYTQTTSQLPSPGSEVHLELDWERRYRHMRLHSCLHLVCALVPGKVTGANINDNMARVDFDFRMMRPAHVLEESLNILINQNAERSIEVFTQKELADNPNFVKILSVKPPENVERVRVIRFKDIDMQPCGGTHVANTREIGEVRVEKILNKGKNNRRVVVSLVD